MERKYYLYILSNYRRTVLYIGITNDLCKRVWGHKQEMIKGFTKRYHTHDVVYYEVFNDALSAIEREKQLKRWSRKKKNILIIKINPSLTDLYPTLCL